MLDVTADRGRFARCIRLVIADPQPIVLQGLRSAFATQRDFEIVAACSSGTSCLEAIRNLAPDVALLADTWPDLTVSGILAIAKTESPSTRLVLFAQSETQDDLTGAVAAGACSAISKYASPETMVRSLRLTTVGIGAPGERSQDLSSNGKEIDGAKIDKMLKALTDRENQIVRLVSEGLSNKEIARELNVSQGTIKVHLYNIFQKLEISNRTVLATISFLQRSAGFGTLSLALALAIRDDAKASTASDTILDDDSTAYKDLEQSVLEPWRNMILRQIVADSGETIALSKNAAPITLSQSRHSAERTEGMHAAEQAVLSNLGRGYGPIGSGAPFLSISPLLQAIKNRQSDGPTNQQQIQSASNSVKNGDGYTTSAEPAGVWVNTRNNLHAVARGLALGETPIDATAVDTAQGTTITIHGRSDVDPHHVDSQASESLGHAPHLPLALETPGRESVTGEGSASQTSHNGTVGYMFSDNGAVVHGGPGSEIIKDYDQDDTVLGGASGNAPNNGNDIVLAGSGDDQLSRSNGDDTFVDLSAKDSRSARLDTIVDLKSPTNQINLAALGALAFLPLTPTSKSVPAHTVAWIYDPVTNETIIYVNTTDGSLDIGDSALLEFHLQGEISVAEHGVVDEPDAAAVAAALEGIDPALLTATEASSSESTFGTAGVWTMPADDGIRFNFGRDHTGSVGSTRLTSASRDSANAAGESNDGAGTVRAHGSSIVLAQSHPSVLIEENLTHKTGPAQTNIGAVATGQGGTHPTAGSDLFELGVQNVAIPIAVSGPVEPDVIPDNSEGHGNSQHASQSASAGSSAGDESTASGIVKGNGNAQHASNPSAEKPPAVAGPVEPDVKADKNGGDGKSQHASQSASAGPSAADESTASGIVKGNGNAQHASNPSAEKPPAVASPVEPDVKADKNGGDGKSQHASQSASAGPSAADESTASGVVKGNGNAQHASNPSAENPPAVAGPVEPDVKTDNSEGHGNSQHASQSASAGSSAADESTASGVVKGNGNAQHASNPSAEKPPAVAGSVEPDNSEGHGNSQHASQSASAGPSAADESTASDVVKGNGNAQHILNPAAAKPSAVAGPVEAGVKADNSEGEGNSQPASQSASAGSSAADGSADSGIVKGNGNSQYAVDPAAAKTPAVAEPVEPGVIADNSNSQHASQPASSATAEPAKSGNGSGNGNAQHASNSASTSPGGATEPVEAGVTPGNGEGHGNSPQASQSAAAMDATEPEGPDLAAGKSSSNGHWQEASRSADANASAAAQPAEAKFSAVDQEPAFHFDNQAAPSTAAGELEEFWPVFVGHRAEPAVILQGGPAAVDEHATVHVSNGHHHAMGHLQAELLP